MNVKSAVFEYGFVRSSEYVGLVAPLIGTEEDRPFGISAPDRHAAAPQLSKDARHARLARSLSGLDAAAGRGL